MKRFLFFVEPDPQDAQKDLEASADLDDRSPNFLQVAAASLSSLPSFESISGDLKALDDHNRRLDLLRAVFGESYGSIDRGNPFGETTEGDRWTEEAPRTQRRVYYKARLHQMLETVAQELSAEALTAIDESFGVGGEGETRRSKALDGKRLQTFFNRFVERDVPEFEPERWSCRLKTPSGDEVDLDAVDVHFSKRALYYWIYELHDWLERTLDETDAEDDAEGGHPAEGEAARLERLRHAIAFLSDRVDMLLIVEAALLKRLRELSETAANENRPLTLAAVFEVWDRAVRGGRALEDAVRGRPVEESGGGDEAQSDVERFAAAYHGRSDDERDWGELMLPVFHDALNNSEPS